MAIDFAKADDLRAVALNMRQRDFEEFCAVSWANTREHLAEALVARYAPMRSTLCIRDEHGPICIGGAIDIRPKSAALLFYATDRFPKVALYTTKFIRRHFLPQLAASGIHRVECVSLASYPEMHRWLRLLGFKQESGPLANYGRDGESFIQFAQVLDARPARH